MGFGFNPNNMNVRRTESVPVVSKNPKVQESLDYMRSHYDLAIESFEYGDEKYYAIRYYSIDKILALEKLGMLQKLRVVIPGRGRLYYSFEDAYDAMLSLIPILTNQAEKKRRDADIYGV